MKYRNSFLLLLLTLLTSCVSDSQDDCLKVTDIYLTHEYNADVNQNVLKQHIKASSLYIFDRTGKLVKKVNLKRDDLVFGSEVASLKGGEYTLVSWANLGEYSKVEYSSQKQTGVVKVVSLLGGNRFTTTDKLYYAKKQVIIPNNNSNASTNFLDKLIYKSAHINFRVIVRGKQGTDIDVIFKNLMPQYDFDRTALRPYETEFRPLIIEETLEEGGYKRLLEFSSFRFKDNNNVTIDVKDKATGEYLTSQLKLKELMDQNGVSVENKQEVYLLIEFSIESGRLVVNIKEWDEDDVIPEN